MCEIRSVESPTNLTRMLETPRGQRARRRCGGVASLVLPRLLVAGAFVSGDCPSLRISVASNAIPGAASVVPEQLAILPLDVPASFSSISSMPGPKTVA